MIISNRFSKGLTMRALLVSLCVILLLAMISVVTAKPRGFGNNPHDTGGINNGGVFIGTGGMKINQDGLKMGARPSFDGGAGGSGSAGAGLSVPSGMAEPIKPAGEFVGSMGAPGTGGFSGSGGTQQPTAGLGTVGSGGFGSGPSNKGGKGDGPGNNVTDNKTGFGGGGGFVGGYTCNGLIMTRRGSDVVVRVPFDNRGDSRGEKGGVVLGCGDAFSRVFSDSDCQSGSFSVPDPIGAKGPNPHHGGQHPNKGCGNPGGGNGNGHWGEGNKGKGKGNIWTGNEGHGVGEGMCGRCCPHDNDNDTDTDVDTDIDIDLDNDIDVDLDNDTDIDLDNDMDIDLDTDLDLDNDTDNDVVGVPAAPLPVDVEMEFSGCPALMQWLAGELGLPKDQIQVYMTNTLATFRDINPCDLCARLQSSALILRDEQGIRISALTEVFDQIAAPGEPISPEQMMQIAQLLAEPQPGSIYEQAAEYLKAAETYVTILREELGYSVDGSFALATKYIEPIEDTNVAEYVTARLIALGR